MNASQTIRRMRAAIDAVRADPRGLLRDAGRLPLQRQASARLKSLPIVELSDLTNGVGEVAIRLPQSTTRHAWSLGVAEQISLQVLIRSRGCKTAFEIGTFNGGTTRILAETLPDEGHVWTIDLPTAQFDATQAPASFDGAQIGIAYRDSPAAHKITQLIGDSLSYDLSSYEQCADLVIVDGGHEYHHGLSDTRSALQLVRPGGMVSGMISSRTGTGSSTEFVTQ